jgi:hypothetical protein
MQAQRRSFIPIPLPTYQSYGNRKAGIFLFLSALVCFILSPKFTPSISFFLL